MKLRNKQTGQIVDLSEGFIRDTYCGEMIQLKPVAISANEGYLYGSLAELNAEWEDAPEEPKVYWTITGAGHLITTENMTLNTKENLQQIGNYFETKEEAERAVKKLEALKRLEDKGFRFIDWELDMKTVADGKIWFDLGGPVDVETALKDESVKASMDLLFGGEE